MEKMGINMRKVKIINNTGAVNVGDCYDLSPLLYQKRMRVPEGRVRLFF